LDKLNGNAEGGGGDEGASSCFLLSLAFLMSIMGFVFSFLLRSAESSVVVGFGLVFELFLFG
jgi:hypothetical protein